MPLYVRLATFTEQGVKNLNNFPDMLGEVKQIMETHGVKLLHAWSTLGEYDLVAVIEAPDTKTATQVSALIAAKGNFRAKTLSAIPMSDFTDAVQQG